MAKNSKTTVLLVTSQPDSRTVIASGLTAAGFDVREFLTGRELLVDFPDVSRSIVVADFRLLDQSGIELAKEVGRRDESIPFLLIAGNADTPAAIQSGLNFIVKPVAADALADEIEFVLSGAKFPSRELDLAFGRLSPRLLQVIVAISHGLTSREIGTDFGTRDKTIESQRSRIMAISRARDVGQLVRMWKQWEGKPKP